MAILKFKNTLSYDSSKVDAYFEKVDAKIEAIEAQNAAIIEHTQGRAVNLPGYCTMCGARRPSGEIGIGGECERICNSFKEHYIEQFYPQLKDNYFKTWYMWSRFCRAMFLHSMQKRNLKGFLASFYYSMLDNTACRLSGKQIKVLMDNCQNSDFWQKYRKIIFKQYNNDKILLYNRLDSDSDFILYCRIQYAKAWV